MKCSGQTIFSGKTLNLIFLGTYIDNSVSITFHTLTPNSAGDLVYRPFLTPSIPAYEVGLGKVPAGMVYIRDYDKYEDAIQALIDEGVVQAGSVQKLNTHVAVCRIVPEVYNNEIVSAAYSV